MRQKAAACHVKQWIVTSHKRAWHGMGGQERAGLDLAASDMNASDMNAKRHDCKAWFMCYAAHGSRPAGSRLGRGGGSTCLAAHARHPPLVAVAQVRQRHVQRQRFQAHRREHLVRAHCQGLQGREHGRRASMEEHSEAQP